MKTVQKHLIFIIQTYNTTPMKNLLFTLTLITILFSGCKKEDNGRNEESIKIITTGTNYTIDLKAVENSQITLLFKGDQTGSNTYTVAVFRKVVFNYTNTGSFTYKLYVNDVLKHEGSKATSGSGSVAVN